MSDISRCVCHAVISTLHPLHSLSIQCKTLEGFLYRRRFFSFQVRAIHSSDLFLQTNTKTSVKCLPSFLPLVQPWPPEEEGAAMVFIYNTLYLTGKNEYLHRHLSQNFDLMKYSNLGGRIDGTLASKIFLKFDINTVNPQWIQKPNSQLAVARFDHAVGVITRDLAVFIEEIWMRNKQIRQRMKIKFSFVTLMLCLLYCTIT